MVAGLKRVARNLFIAGDWGTSKLRLYLCEFIFSGGSRVLETQTGPGVSQIPGEFEITFFTLAQDWLSSHGNLPVILSGMAGSTIGWREAPYLQCPVGVDEVVLGRVAFESCGLEFSIVAGLKVCNPLGAADVMRGEELQLLGWMRSQSHSSNAANIIALPGTHNKWVLTRDGVIETFLSALTGELFALLNNHSVLISERESTPFSQQAFMEGVTAVEQLDDAQLLHALFSTRARQLLAELSATDASSYLSGLLIGSDVVGATAVFRDLVPDYVEVTLIGEGALSDRYRLVLEHLGIASNIVDTTQIAIAGYEAVYENLYGGS